MANKNAVLWITDPWSTLDHPNDTTLRLIEESLRLKIPTYWSDVRSVRLEDQKILLSAQRVLSVGAGRHAQDFKLDDEFTCRPDKFPMLHYRVDPPVDSHYLHPLQLVVDAIRGKRARLVNPPQVLLAMSEKSGAGLPASWVPVSFVGVEPARLEAFGRRIGKTVAKPPHFAQSKGVRLLEWKTPEQVSGSLEILREMTENFMTPTVLQEFLEDVYQGEKRLWYVRGKLLASVLKKPLQGDFRVLVDQGSEVASTVLTAPERRRAEEIGKYLRRAKIALAAVDLIGGKISDLNFTSPGLIVQMEKITGRNLAAPILKALG
jgi:glutathione synthase